MFLLSQYDPANQTQFRDALMVMALRLRVRPEYLLMCFYFEARLNPHFQTSRANGTGFLQLSKAEIQSTGTTPERILRMSGADQLQFIEKYLTPYAGHMTTLIDVYMACFFQDGVEKSDSFYFRLPLKYKTAGKVFPLRNNNRIQKWEIDRYLRSYFIRMGWDD